MLLGWRRCGGGRGPVERDQLRPAEARLDEREQDEAVALGEPGAPPRRVFGGREQPGELLLSQPVGFREHALGETARRLNRDDIPPAKADASGGRRRCAPLLRRSALGDVDGIH